MAISCVFFLQAILLSLLPNFQPAVGCFDSIFSFGDSHTDTGNLIRSPFGKSETAARLPYGETYFHRPTGRFSDGRIVLDFIAEAMGLPLVPPFLGGSLAGDGFRHGANFAVGGATALDMAFFREERISVAGNNYSLGVQVEWFKRLLPSLCSSNSECNHRLSKSLFIVGDIGGNDYNYALSQGRPVKQVESYTPQIISTTSIAIIDLIELGARTIVVPGEIPFGCTSRYLTMFASPRQEDYDPHTGCLKWLNELSVYHNRGLLAELDQIRQRYPHVTIIYANNYDIILSILRSPHSYGFGDKALAACCGGVGPYHYDLTAVCGVENTWVCADPSKYFFWDGMHNTEAAYKWIATGLLNGSLKPLVNTKCPDTAGQREEQTQNGFQSM